VGEESLSSAAVFAAITPDDPEIRPVTNFPSAPVGLDRIALDNQTLAVMHPMILRAQAMRVTQTQQLAPTAQFAPQSVPEPTSLALLAASSFLLLRRQRRRIAMK
jgi:hypothetical protein